MAVLVTLALATICFTSQNINHCYPILLGKNTPIGKFQIIRRYTDDPGYGGDVLQFYEDNHQVYAIHRVWLLKPQQRRLERLDSNNIEDHLITNGCINIKPEVYEELVNCCSNDELIVK